jgi:hypothetical protein
MADRAPGSGHARFRQNQPFRSAPSHPPAHLVNGRFTKIAGTVIVGLVVLLNLFPLAQISFGM